MFRFIYAFIRATANLLSASICSECNFEALEFTIKYSLFLNVLACVFAMIKMIECRNGMERKYTDMPSVSWVTESETQHSQLSNQTLLEIFCVYMDSKLKLICMCLIKNLHCKVEKRTISEIINGERFKFNVAGMNIDFHFSHDNQNLLNWENLLFIMREKKKNEMFRRYFVVVVVVVFCLHRKFPLDF